MTKDYTAIRVSKASKEQAEAAKRDGETWDDYIRRCTDNPPEVKEFVSAKDVAAQSDFEPSGQTVDLEATTINKIVRQVVEELR